MLKSEVQIGKTYVAKISGNLVKVRIDEVVVRRGYGGRPDRTAWNATNLRSGRKVLIESAAKLRREVPVVKGRPAKDYVLPLGYDERNGTEGNLTKRELDEVLAVDLPDFIAP